MAIFFSDTFSTDGALSGQLPQAPFASGLAWYANGTSLDVASGSAVVPSPTTSNTLASATYGLGTGTNYGKPAPIRLTFTMRTPPNLGNVSGVDHGGVQLFVKCGGITTSVRVWGQLSGGVINWYANINTTTYIAITSQLAPSTDYNGVLDISNGSQVFTFLGNVLSNTVAFTDTDGLNEITMFVRGYSSVGIVSVNSNVNGNGDYVAPGVGTVALTAPSPILVATNMSGIAALTSPSALLKSFGGANAALLSPSASLAALGGARAALTGTFPIFYAAGHNSSGENDFAGTAPMASLVFAGGANAKLTAPSPTLAITATFSGFGTADLTAPAALVDASGTTSGTASARLRAPMGKMVGYFGGVISVTTTNSPTLVASGTADPIGSATLVAPMASAIGYSGAVCSITLTGGLTLLATGSGGGVGVATVSCPLFELTASGTAQNYGSANLLAPSPRMGATAQAWLIAPGATLTAIGTAVVTATYEAYSVNLKHKVRMQGEQPAIDEVTHYTNFPFDRIVRYQNSYFGVAADGLYLLEGTTDDGAAIACTLETHISDFDIPEKKTIVSARIGGRFGPTSTVTLHVGETGQTAYSYTTPRGQLAQNHREKFGRGIKDRYFGLEVATTGALEIDQLELEINKLTRRI